MYPALIDVPYPIRTPRLLLRPSMPNDGEEVNAAIWESFNELRPWMPWAQAKPTIHETELNVRRSFAQWIVREDLRMLIFELGTKKLIGSTGLHRINWDVPRFEIGYWVRTHQAGKGYITESTNALTRYAFLQLQAKRVEIVCSVKNEKSIAVARRLGFEEEARLRNHNIRHDTGEVCDSFLFARVTMKDLPSLEVQWV